MKERTGSTNKELCKPCLYFMWKIILLALHSVKKGNTGSWNPSEVGWHLTTKCPQGVEIYANKISAKERVQNKKITCKHINRYIEVGYDQS